MEISTYSALHIKKSGFWWPAADINAFFFIDEKNKMEYKGCFLGGETAESWEITKVIQYNDCIYFFSRISFELWKYDIKHDEVTNHKYYSSKSIGLISNVEFFNGRVWVFPADYTIPIININLDKMQIVEVHYPIDISFGCSGLTRTVIFGDKVYWMNRMESNIFIFHIDCKSNKISYKKLDDAKYVDCIEVFDNKIFVLYKDNKLKNILGTLDINNYEILNKVDVTENVNLSNDDGITYIRMIYRNNCVFIFPVGNYDIIMINNEKIKKINDKKICKENIVICNNDIQIEDNKVYIYSPNELGVRVLDLNSYKIREVEIFVENAYIDVMKKQKYGENIFCESSNMKLSDFITIL